MSQCQSKRTQANDESIQSTIDEHQVKLEQHNKEIKTAESLARAVSSSRLLRQRIDGLSIGVTSDSRAAPGLEACMDAASRSSQERRITSAVTVSSVVRYQLVLARPLQGSISVKKQFV